MPSSVVYFLQRRVVSSLSQYTACTEAYPPEKADEAVEPRAYSLARWPSHI